VSSAPLAVLDARGERASGLRRVLINALSLLLAYILPKLLTLGAIITAARVLGVSGFGQYGTAAAFAVILSIVATLGMQPLLIREMAKRPQGAADWLRSAHVVKTASNLVMLALLVALADGLMDYPVPVRLAALLLGLSYAIGAYAENLAAWFQSVERMEVWMQASAAAGLVTGALGAILVLSTRNVVAFCAAPLLGQIASLAWLASRLPRDMHRGHASRASVARLLRALVPFAAGFIAITLHSKIAVPLLARWWPSDEVGLYTAAYKFIDLVQALAVVGAAAVYPRLARLPNAHNAATRLVEITMLAGVLAGGTLWLARSEAVHLLFGSGYAGAAAPTAWLALGIAPLAINIVGGYVLAAAGEIRRVAVLYAGATLIKIALVAVLVPDLGATGTALAMLITEATLATGMLVVLRRRADVRPGARTWSSAALAVSAWALLVLLREPLGALAAAALFVVAAILLFGVAGGVPRADRELLLAALRPHRAIARSAP
jgi:O-antigen/teichoic acid export membrane protein